MASKNRVVKVDRRPNPAAPARELTNLELIQELQREVLQLDRQNRVQRRVRGLARQLALAERQLYLAAGNKAIAGLFEEAAKQKERARRAFVDYLAELPFDTYDVPGDYGQKGADMPTPARGPDMPGHYGKSNMEAPAYDG